MRLVFICFHKTIEHLSFQRLSLFFTDVVPNPHINSVNEKCVFRGAVESIAARELDFSPALPLTKLGGVEQII